MIKIHSLFFNPPKPEQSQLSSHFDFGVNTSALFHPQYHDWSETLEQGTKPPTAPRAPQQYGCPLLRVCVYSVCEHLDGLNAEHKFRVWVTILGHTSLHFHKICLCLAVFKPDCFLNEGQFKAGFVKKLKLKDGSVPIVHDPAAPPEEVSLTLFIFLWLFANRICSSTEERGGVSRAH